MRPIIILAALAVAATGAFAQPLPARLSLSQVLELVDQANPEIQSARLKALETGARAAALHSTMGPQLNAGAAQGYQTNNLAGVGLLIPWRAVPRWTLSRVRPSSASDPNVFDLSLWANVRAEKLRSQADSADADAATEKLRLTVTELYIQSAASGLPPPLSRSASDQRRVAAASKR